MASAKDICAAYAAQNKAKGKAGNVFFEGAVIYSYGHHFPMALIRGNRAFVNSDRYSVSTSRQQGRVRSALSSRGFVVTEKNTVELRAIIAGGES